MISEIETKAFMDRATSFEEYAQTQEGKHLQLREHLRSTYEDAFRKYLSVGPSMKDEK